MRWNILVACAAAIAAMVFGPASAQAPVQAPKKTPLQNLLTQRLNENTVSVISGNPNGTYLQIAYDLSAVLDDGDRMRILPIVGKGGAQNVRDIMFLKGVDMGITQANVLTYFRKTNEIGPIDNAIVYIARLYNEEMHILVGPEIKSLEDLRGKKVNFSDIGSGTQSTTRLVFDLLQIGAEEVNMGQNDAFERLKSGEIAATVLIAGKPSGAFKGVKREGGLHLLPVPYNKPLQADYYPTTLTHEDYPNLLDQGESVDTIAVSAVLAAYNWPKGSDRYARIARFVNDFFAKIEEFQKPPRHPKWKEVNIAAEVPGWKRFGPAQEWLDRAGQVGEADSEVRRRFNVFLSERGVDKPPAEPRERDRLFQDFLQWSKTKGRN